jgi:hypothetical protein
MATAISSNTPSAVAKDAGGAPSSIPPPIPEEPEVILVGGSRPAPGQKRRRLPSLGCCPALIRLSRRPRRRSKAASCQFASERSELEQEREDFKEDLEKVFDRKQEVTQKEKGLVKKEEHLNQREAVITEFHEKLKAYNVMLEKQRDEQTATEAALQKLRRELDDRASNLSLAEENLKAKDASLEERAMALVWQEKDLAWREEMRERREMLLAKHELEVEEKERKLEEQVRRFQATQIAQVAQTAQAALGSQAVEAMKKTLEDLWAEHCIGAQRIAAWADEASSALVPLGVSPILVSKQSVSISDALPVLDSAADRLRCLDQILGTCLEAEGSRLCQAVIEYVLTCFRSHDSAISLGPVIAGLVADTEDAARGSVQDAVDAVAKRFQRDPADDE